jgi:hypothetical protein
MAVEVTVDPLPVKLYTLAGKGNLDTRTWSRQNLENYICPST